MTAGLQTSSATVGIDPAGARRTREGHLQSMHADAPAIYRPVARRELKHRWSLGHNYLGGITAGGDMRHTFPASTGS